MNKELFILKLRYLDSNYQERVEYISFHETRSGAEQALFGELADNPDWDYYIDPEILQK